MVAKNSPPGGKGGNAEMDCMQAFAATTDSNSAILVRQLPMPTSNEATALRRATGSDAVFAGVLHRMAADKFADVVLSDLNLRNIVAAESRQTAEAPASSVQQTAGKSATAPNKWAGVSGVVDKPTPFGSR